PPPEDAAPPVPDETPALDIGMLQAWQKLGMSDGESFLKEVITLFLDTTPPMLRQMRAECACHNSDNLRRLAHKLRGSSANLGAVRLAQACAQLEHFPSESAPNAWSDGTWSDLVGTIESEFASVRTSLLRDFLLEEPARAF